MLGVGLWVQTRKASTYHLGPLLFTDIKLNGVIFSSMHFSCITYLLGAPLRFVGPLISLSGQTCTDEDIDATVEEVLSDVSFDEDEDDELPRIW